MRITARRTLAQSKVRIITIAIRISQRNDCLAVPIGIDLKDLVELFVADIEKASGIPDWPLCKTKASRQLFKSGAGRNKFPELRGQRLKAEPARGLCSGKQRPQKEANNERRSTPESSCHRNLSDIMGCFSPET